jgi:hypothetical protein
VRSVRVVACGCVRACVSDCPCGAVPWDGGGGEEPLTVSLVLSAMHDGARAFHGTS